ncbi:Pimeloyl-ACP methyl ester carboxylesterase [Micromonospora pallida]|uniref:Pimeloyl-ACP methyl ester carboxylesterase n=1 Tax=Micromonospora pallida TaxID=145854 RepID=A0A1C6SCU0_9ACTN|nr:alpha/beta hydrolase [Micromonospora pallida]SCL27299.1 Pimeloyl-ACP methyl ester carboxylesterase [Micromonospora pallida]
MATMRLGDGRGYAFEEWGDARGRALFWLYGAPGGRLARHSDPDLWRRLGLRVVTVDRPGYGQSTPLPGRPVSHVAADVAAVADRLGIDRFAVQGLSAGGPYALALAALLGDRVAACAAVGSVAPLTVAEEAAMADINRESFRLVREEGRAGLARRLTDLREKMLADPYGSQVTHSPDASPEERDWLTRPEVRRIAAENLVDALRPGVDGWADDAVALVPGQPWGFDPATITCPVRFWHGDDDANSPLSAVRRLVTAIPQAALTIWYGEGHTAPSRHAEDVLVDLLAHWR